MSRDASRGGPAALLVRAALAAGLGAVGAIVASRLLANGVLTGPNNVLYLALLGLLLGWLIGARPAKWIDARVSRIAERLGSAPPEAVLAALTGATVALVLTVLLNNVLASVPGFTWYWSLLIAGLLMISTTAFFVANRRVLPFTTEQADDAGETAGRPKLLDTSAIIDGRLVDVAKANFLEGRLLVPDFVLGELQRIADDPDALRRKRGRRGLETLERLAEQPSVETEIVRDAVPEASAVDDKLVLLARRRGADLVTTDFNLHQVAKLQGVRVLNLNQLASAVKATYLPGETLSLSVVRPGREAGQGLAYLDDGTMVVIEDAADLVGENVEATVTSSLQTNVGRMIFARLDAEDAPDASP